MGKKNKRLKGLILDMIKRESRIVSSLEICKHIESTTHSSCSVSRIGQLLKSDVAKGRIIRHRLPGTHPTAYSYNQDF